MKITLTNNQIYAALQGMQKIAKIPATSAFYKGILRNQKIFQKELKKVHEAIIDPSAEHKKYMEEREKIVKEYQEKVTEAKRAEKPLPDRDKHLKNLEKLEKKYEVAINVHKENEEKNKKLFETEVEVEVIGIKESDWPQMTTEQAAPLIELMLS